MSGDKDISESIGRSESTVNSNWLIRLYLRVQCTSYTKHSQHITVCRIYILPIYYIIYMYACVCIIITGSKNSWIITPFLIGLRKI